MKIPRIVSPQQALTIAGVAAATFVFLKLFGSFVTAALVLLTVVSLIYYGIVEYLPQFVEPEKPKK